MKKRRELRPKKLFGAMADRKNEEVPSFTRILSRHGLCAPDLPVSEAFDLFTKIASDSVVIALKPRTTVPRTNILGIYGATAAALSRLNDAQKAKLLERIAAPFRIYQIKNEGVREYR